MGGYFEGICIDPATTPQQLQAIPIEHRNRPISAQSGHPLSSILWYRHHPQFIHQDQLFRWYPSMLWFRTRCQELHHPYPWGYLWRRSCWERGVAFPFDCGLGHRHVLLTPLSGMKSNSWKTALTHFSQRYKSACEIVEPKMYKLNKKKQNYA